MATRTRTLVVAADFIPLYDRVRGTVNVWPKTYGLTPIAHVSDTDVFDLDDTIRILGRDTMQPALEEIRARATITVPAVVCGIAEVARLLGVHRVLAANWDLRGQLPPPAAVLRPAVNEHGVKARQLKVWTLEQFPPAMYSTDDAKKAAQEIAKQNMID